MNGNARLVVRSRATLWFRAIWRRRFWLVVLVVLPLVLRTGSATVLALRAGSRATGDMRATGVIVRIHRVSIDQVIRLSFIIRIVWHLCWRILGNFIVVTFVWRLVGVEGGAAGGGGVGTRVYSRSSARCPFGGEGAEKLNAGINQL